MKGMIFAGCSFTWGQGLYYYSKFDTLREPAPDTFDEDLLTHAHMRYAATLRYPRLVANHFNTFEVVSKQNGGSEKNSIDFLNQTFGLTEKFAHLMDEKFNFSEIEYIIIQTSQPNRNPYYYITDDGQKHIFLSHDHKTKSRFYEWLFEERRWSFDEWYSDHKTQWLTNIKEIMKFFESKGIKTKILCWEDDYLPLIKNDKWLFERFITLFYKNIRYECVRNLMNENKYLTINSDYDYFENPPKDHHPSLECHKIIAENIIKNIEQSEKVKTNVKFI